MRNRAKTWVLLILCAILLGALTFLVSGYPVNSGVTDAKTAGEEARCLLALMTSPLDTNVPDTALPLVRIRFGPALSADADWLPARVTLTAEGFADADWAAHVYAPQSEALPTDEEASYRISLKEISRKVRVKSASADLLGIGESADWLLAYSTPQEALLTPDGREVRLLVDGRDLGVFHLTPYVVVEDQTAD